MLSNRISISWPPNLPNEITDTLVITSTSNSINRNKINYFLDLRIFNSNSNSNQNLKGKLEWATAGIKTWLPESTIEKPKASFKAIINSRKSLSKSSSLSSEEEEEEDSSPDEGNFKTLSNGDVLETGTMLNPDTNKIEPYEEIWRRLKIKKGSWCIILESFDEEEEEIEIEIEVKKNVENNKKGKAFLGRIGNDELSMIEGNSDREFGFRRINLLEEGNVVKVIYSSGGEVDTLLPRIPIEGIDGNIDDIIELGERKWIIRENAEVIIP